MKSSRIYYGWWIVVASVLGLMVCNGPVIYTFTIFIPPLVEEFGWGRGDISLATTFHLIANALAMPFAGKLVDSYGVRRVLVPSILIWGIGVAMVGAIPASLLALYAIFVFIGIVTSGASPLPYGRAIASWFDRRRGLALGLAMSGTGLGTLMMPILAQHLIDGYGWRLAFTAIGALVIAVALLFVIPLMRDKPAPDSTDAPLDSAPPGMSVAASLRTKQFRLMGIAFFLVAMTVVGTAAHLFPLLVDRGMAPGTAALSVSVLGVTLLLGRIWAGYLMDRFFAPYVAIGFIFGPIIGCILLASGASGPLAFVAAVGIGLGIGAEVDFIAYLISRYFGLKSFGSLYGYLFGAFLVGGGIGPPLMGYAHDLWGTYTYVLTLFAVLPVGACLLLSRLGPYPQPEAAMQKAS